MAMKRWNREVSGFRSMECFWRFASEKQSLFLLTAAQRLRAGMLCVRLDSPTGKRYNI